MGPLEEEVFENERYFPIQGWGNPTAAQYPASQ